NLAESRITDEGLMTLRELNRLKQIVLGERITDAGWSALKSLKSLNTIDATPTKMTGQSVLMLEEMPHLKTLKLDRGQVSDTGRAELLEFKNQNPQCQIVLESQSGESEELE
ncbi:MAG: hypothetical protein KDA84_19385, partial [Planctomycetaceae bacterium]|nr:hypothetical protein [Planctomycetaceae bacterium]